MDELDDFFRTSEENNGFDALLQELDNLGSISKSLQCGSIYMSHALNLFDAVLNYYPEAVEHLPITDRTLHNPVSKSAIVRMRRGYIQSMSREQVMLMHFFDINAKTIHLLIILKFRTRSVLHAFVER